MRLSFLTSACILAAPLAAQDYYIPDNQAGVGTCNVIPFGSSSLSTWGNQKYQTKATPADLANIPGIITGLGFAPCGTGNIHFDAIEVVLDHHPTGVPLDPTFANNLTPNAVTVLSATNYDWHITANAWNEIGLQTYFVYNGVDDLVVEITVTNAITTGVTGFHRGTRERLYWYATTGPAAPSGTLGNAAGKWEVSQLTARLSTYGVGCAGTNGTPSHSLTGSSQIGNTVGLDVANGLPNGFAFAVLGFYNGAPFPLDLASLGMPTCLQYNDQVATTFAVLDGSGAGSVPFAVPASSSFVGVLLYSQYACIDPGANTTGATTTNYGRILIGN